MKRHIGMTLAWVALGIGGLIAVAPDHTVTTFEDGSYVTSEGRHGCNFGAPCSEEWDGLVAWEGVTQDTTGECAYWDGWGEPECVVAAMAEPGESLTRTMSRLGF